MLKQRVKLIVGCLLVSQISHNQVVSMDFFDGLTSKGVNLEFQHQEQSIVQPFFLSRRNSLTDSSMIPLTPIYKKNSKTSTNAPQEMTKTNVSTTTNVTQTLRAREVPRPPKFKLLTVAQKQDLIANAKAGDESLMNNLLERIYWGVIENPLTLDDVLKIDNIHHKAMSSRGYLYWYIIECCDGFLQFPELPNKIKHLAEHHGLATAQHAWGSMNYEGKGISRGFFSTDTKNESVKWFQKAAQQNFASSQHWLGTLYDNGICGLSVDKTKALEYYQLAADQGYTYGVGYCHYFGACGIKENKLTALRLWFKGNQNYSIQKFIKEKLTYKDTTLVITPWSAEACLQEMLNLSYKFEVDLLTSSQSMNDSSFQEIIREFRSWLQMMPSFVEVLRKTEPGFFITCIEHSFSSQKMKAQEKPKFLNECYTKGKLKSYLIVGEENNRIFDIERDWYKRKNKLGVRFEEFKEDYDVYYNNYKKKLGRFKNEQSSMERLIIQNNALTQNPSFTLQHEKLKVKIMVYEEMIQQRAPTIALLQSWGNSFTDIWHVFVVKYLKDGTAQRNADFIAYHPYLKD